MLTIYDVIS